MDVLLAYYPRLLDGLLTTAHLVGLSLVIGAAMSIPIALARSANSRLLWMPAYAYIYFFRGTPLIAQVFLVYYGSGQFREFFQDVGLWTYFRDSYFCAVFTFALNTAAYQAEIMRGGIMQVPHGEIEAAKACGMSRWKIYGRVIFPNAYRIAFPALGNEVVLMIKGSAIASVITIYDLMGQTKYAFSRSFDFDIYLWAAIMYLVITLSFERIWKTLEARLNPQWRKRSSEKMDGTKDQSAQTA